MKWICIQTNGLGIFRDFIENARRSCEKDIVRRLLRNMEELMRCRILPKY